MPRRNKIELQGLVERIVEMFHEQKMSQRDIADVLKDEGYDVSKSGVGRVLLNHAGQMKAYKEAAMEAAAIVKELKTQSGLDLAEATSQILQTKLLGAVKNVDIAELDDMELEKLFSAVHKNATNQVQIARVKLEYERGYNKGLFKAAEVVEAEGKKAGISDENMELIKARILGLKVSEADE